jgi:ABC-2 type transport system ATP-binding protein
MFLPKNSSKILYLLSRFYLMFMGKLECNDLTKVYDNQYKALDCVSFSVETSGIFGLIGRNGAGKTTLIRILATELEATFGTASINGDDIVKEPGKVRDKIAIVPQEARAIRWMTPKQTVFSYLLWRGYSYKDAHRLADESLARLGLHQYANVLNSKLSGGTKRKVLIATVTASEANIIFLDEPTTGLDPISRRELWGILRELGKTRFIFLTTHYLEEAEQLADRIGILKGGKLVSIGTLSELRNTSKYQYSIKLPPKTEVPTIADASITTSQTGVTQIMTNEAEAFRLAKQLSDQGVRYSIAAVTLDDIFFHLVGEKAGEDNEA